MAALYSPEEYVVDPYLLPLSNLYVALHHGCQLETLCRVIAVTKEREQNGESCWKVKAEKREGGKSFVTFFRAKKVINCGGNYSDELDHLVPRTIDEAKPFTIQPGRGEYVVLAPNSKKDSRGPLGMVTQVPTKFYAGLYVFKSVYGHYVVGKVIFRHFFKGHLNAGKKKNLNLFEMDCEKAKDVCSVQACIHL